MHVYRRVLGGDYNRAPAKMIGRRVRQLVVASVLSLVVIISVFAVRNNQHKAASEYLQGLIRLKVLQILYPQHHYTKENATDILIIPEISLDDFKKYDELEAQEGYERENATFFSLVRNEELYLMLQSIKYVENRFNKRYHYNWVFANDEPFTELFQSEVGNLVSGESTFVHIPREMWEYPESIDQKRAADTRHRMKKQGIKYGGSESYRFMCRFNSGFFYKLKALEKYRYYWRVEPDIKFTCDLGFDYFRHMRENQLKYGWTMSLHELAETVDGLFEATKEFFREIHPEYVSSNNQIEFITENGEKSFNMCHYWSNFELGDLDWLRSPAYEEFFQHLESKGGFFYERWGDAPVHTLAASYMLDKNEVYYFDNTGYYHVPHTQCPRELEQRASLRCTCQLSNDFNWGSTDSCLPYWYETRDQEKPSWAPRKKNYKAMRRPSPELEARDYEEDEQQEDKGITLNDAPLRRAFAD